MLFLANGMHALEPTTPISSLVEAENQAEARVKFVNAVTEYVGSTSYLSNRTIQVTGIIT